jgi:gluconokinase
LIIIVMGVSGSGKTTVGRALASATGGTFFEGDDFHPVANVEKMRRGVPLTEAEREPWLSSLRDLVEEWAPRQELAVLACSALTRRSRARLHVGEDGVRLVFLHGPPETLDARLRSRQHFFPPTLLASQLATLVPPEDALELDVREPVDQLVRRIREAWGL